MSKVFLLALIATLAYFFVRSLFKPIRKPEQKPAYKKRSAESATEMVQDPVCGMFVDPKKSLSLERRGVSIFFCSDQCRSEYLRRIEQGEKQ